MLDNTYSSLHNIVTTHPNAGTPFASVEFRLNSVPYLNVDTTRKASFNGAVGANGDGFLVNNVRVVGGQLARIEKLSSSATNEDRNAKINEIIEGLTLHGLFAR